MAGLYDLKTSSNFYSSSTWLYKLPEQSTHNKTILFMPSSIIQTIDRNFINYGKLDIPNINQPASIAPK